MALFLSLFVVDLQHVFVVGFELIIRLTLLQAFIELKPNESLQYVFFFFVITRTHQQFRSTVESMAMV